MRCGDARYGFVEVSCDDCHQSRVVAFCCKGRGWCPSCTNRRAVETGVRLAALLPWVRHRQWRHLHSRTCGRRVSEEMFPAPHAASEEPETHSPDDVQHPLQVRTSQGGGNTPQPSIDTAITTNTRTLDMEPLVTVSQRG